MLKESFISCLTLLILLVAQPVFSGDSSVFTLWPLLDYRADDNIDYRSFHLLGPLFKSERKGEETESALRPLYYRAANQSGSSQLEVLYPLLSLKSGPDSSRFNFLQLLSSDAYDGGEDRSRKFFLFPLIFYGSDPEQGDYFAIFPLGGQLRGWFGRDEITFALFPLYGRTLKGERRIDNVLWPFFARISGKEESGYKFWPIYGQSEKIGHYRKKFFLWPIFFSEDLDLAGDNPVRRRAAFPFYLSIESAESSEQFVLWPFFSKRADMVRNSTEWNFPWPLIRLTRGETRHGFRLLPFCSDETVEANRKRWYFWPVYKIEDTQTAKFERRRHRVLYFLYSDLREMTHDSGQEKRRVALWPLFSYSRQKGVRHLHVFSLLEPFFPENTGIEHSWAPLWRVYQQKWDQQGNRIISLFWNLFWQEKRDQAMAWELFPLLEYARDPDEGIDWKVLKGLFRYQSGRDGKSLKLFYLPWGLSWGGHAVPAGTM
jgi:hypothetical protein